MVLRAGLPDVAIMVGNLIMKWHVRMWGVEGNYNQKMTFGDVIEDYLEKYMKSMNWSDFFTRNQGVNNTGDKILRIKTHISNAIGIEGTPIQLFVNKNAEEYEQFDSEITMFPQVEKNVKHEFDLLDCVTSVLIHFRSHGEAWFLSSNS